MQLVGLVVNVVWGWMVWWLECKGCKGSRLDDYVWGAKGIGLRTGMVWCFMRNRWSVVGGWVSITTG